ncbi:MULTISPECIES: hypothetical protein [Thioclava]|uniref:Uncharacterized protein n=1 Tax=Thioclava electrotropha TaxID=1549850 RepID=A0ABX6Z051_9RHOB|nr:MULTISPECIES: hypothetical protein [Thioclava]QPZ93425.1 hypothetical protein AKL02_020910 [Thioclava electrotropha]
MTRDSVTATRDAAPASWGAHGAARGSPIASLEKLDRIKQRRHQESTLSGDVSR